MNTTGNHSEFDLDRRSCPMSTEDPTIAATCQYWLEGVLLVLVGIFGLLGNSLSIIILTGPNMRNSFNLLLVVLICCDNTFILFAVLDYACVRVFSWPFDGESEAYAMIFPKLLYPLNNITICCSIGLTVAIAFERYCAVCHPFYYRDAVRATSVKYRVAKYVIPVIVFAIILNIPKFFETEIFYIPVNKTGLDESAQANDTASYILTYDVTELRKDKDYIRYYQNWCRLIFTCIIPGTALIYFNTKIFRGIKFTHMKSNKSGSSEVNLATVLICIVIVFLFCHIPRVILNCTEFFMVEDMFRCPATFSPSNYNLCLASLNHWLLIVNSSSNFLIYCSMGEHFKLALAQALKRLTDRIFKVMNGETLDILSAQGQGLHSFESKEESGACDESVTVETKFEKQVEDL